jgi:hypothetical protein
MGMKDLLLILLLVALGGGAFFHLGMEYQEIKCLQAFTDWLGHTAQGTEVYLACTGSEWE